MIEESDAVRTWRGQKGWLGLLIGIRWRIDNVQWRQADFVDIVGGQFWLAIAWRYENLLHRTILTECWMANQAGYLTANHQHQYSTTSFQHFDRLIVIGFDHWHTVHLDHFVAHTKTSQIGGTAFGDTRYEYTLVVAFEWRRTTATGNAQTQAGRSAFNVNFIIFQATFSQTV